MQVFSRVLFVIGSIVFAAFATQTYAATLYIDPHEAELYPGDTMALAVRIDTDEDECINVVDGVITYTQNIVAIDISRGDSILPVWVEDPVIDKANKRVTFAGGIPNGYCGRIAGDPRLSNIVLELIVQAPGFQIGIGERSPVAEVTFADSTRVLLNDGAGTPAPLQTLGASIFMYEKPGVAISDEWNDRVSADNTPPSEFSISLNKEQRVFSGKYFIAFNTTDKQSGIDHYEVMEEPLEDFKLFRFGAATAPWVRAKSPYVLEDQSLNSTIRVRAIDKAGNEYIATLVPDESVRGISQQNKILLSLAIAGSIVLVVVLSSTIIMLRRRRTVVVEQPTEEVLDSEP